MLLVPVGVVFSVGKSSCHPTHVIDTFAWLLNLAVLFHLRRRCKEKPPDLSFIHLYVRICFGSRYIAMHSFNFSISQQIETKHNKNKNTPFVNFFFVLQPLHLCLVCCAPICFIWQRLIQQNKAKTILVQLCSIQWEEDVCVSWTLIVDISYSTFTFTFDAVCVQYIFQLVDGIASNRREWMMASTFTKKYSYPIQLYRISKMFKLVQSPLHTFISPWEQTNYTIQNNCIEITINRCCFMYRYGFQT